MYAQKIEELEKERSSLENQVSKPTKRISQINMKIAALAYSEDLQALIKLRFHTQELVYQAACAEANRSHAVLCKYFANAKPLNHKELSFKQLEHKYESVQVLFP